MVIAGHNGEAFLAHLDQFLSFTDNFMVVSFKEIISKSALDIMKLAYRDLKLGNV